MKFTEQENEKRRRKIKTNAKRVKNKGILLAVRVLFAVAVIGGFSAAGAVLGWYSRIIENSPEISYIQSGMDGSFTTIVYYDSTGEENDRYDGGESREYVTVDKVPRHLLLAFVAIEDERFFQHDGIDIKGIFRAAHVMLTSSDTQGASTITQQVIKNKLGMLKNTPETKLQEQSLAIKFEKDLTEALGSKEEAKLAILEQYINNIGLGDGQIGVQAAALHYFGKDASELTIAESAVIAAITQWPTKYTPTRRPENNEKRKNLVLMKMLELGFITEAEHDAAVAEDVYSVISSVYDLEQANPSYHSSFNEALYEQVVKDLMEQKHMTRQDASHLFFYGGLSIYSTQDPAMQAIVDSNYLDEENFPKNDYSISVEYIVSIRNNVTNKVENYVKRQVVKNEDEADAYVEKVRNDLLGIDREIAAERIYFTVQPQSAFVVLDQHTGQVKALAGQRGEKKADKTLNRATDAYRQPGSAFKVLASYAAAFDENLVTPGSIIDDVPFTQGGYTPKNWDRSNPYKGLVTVRAAIKDSMNICAVKNMNNTGVTTCLNYLLNFGFTSLVNDDYNLATALGGITNGVSPLELTAAYATIANGGEYIQPSFYTKVIDHDGAVLLERRPDTRVVLKPTAAYLLTDVMRDVVRAGTGGQANFKTVKMPIAGKTGTTTDDKDLVFVGYTPYYTAGIWLGNDKPSPMTGSGTSSVHTRLWGKIMEEIHADLPYQDFERPNGIVTATICTVSGKLAVEGLCDSDPRGSRVRSEIFEAGTQPSSTCDVHRVYSVDVGTGMRAGPYCPPEETALKVGIARPYPYEGPDAELIGDRQYEYGLLPECNLHTHYMPPAEPGDNPETEAPALPAQTPEPSPGIYYPPSDTD